MTDHRLCQYFLILPLWIANFLKHAERNFTIKMNKSNAEKINVVKLKSFMTNKSANTVHKTIAIFLCLFKFF